MKNTYRAGLLALSVLLPVGSLAQQQSTTPNADWHRTVDNGLGKPGTEQPGGVWRVALPRTDLKVTLDGVELRPASRSAPGSPFTRTARS